VIAPKPPVAADTSASTSQGESLAQPDPPVRVRRGEVSAVPETSPLTSSVRRLATTAASAPHIAYDSPDLLDAYGDQADTYEARTSQFMVFRQRLVDALDVRNGDVVVDVGCGTGLCLPLLQERIGAEGAIIAVDESAAMLDIARARAEEAGWSNVTFIRAPAAQVDLRLQPDAALFCAVHDIVRSPESVRNILSQLRPGARIASGGGKWAAPWMIPLNSYIASLHRPFIRSFDGFDSPWSLLTPLLQDLRITEMEWGSGYVATARVPD
jgi:SAM-dependent methyltransferase